DLSTIDKKLLSIPKTSNTNLRNLHFQSSSYAFQHNPQRLEAVVFQYPLETPTAPEDATAAHNAYQEHKHTLRNF
ncbi:hypothetical protein EDC96DRAFT_449692, partial [Choanephora cucurbitarum]